MWADEERATFYSWGGAESAGDWYPSDYQDNLPTTAIWQFSPNGDIGSWNEVGDDADSGLKNLVRPAYGSGASGNGAGYLYGGYLYEKNNASIDRSYSDAPVPGLISYDFRQNKWTNTIVSVEGAGSKRYQRMEFAPMFGTSGVVLSFGGGTYPNTSDSNLADFPLSSLGKIDVYDPSTEKVSGSCCPQSCQSTT